MKKHQCDRLCDCRVCNCCTGYCELSEEDRQTLFAQERAETTEPIKSKWDHYGLPVYRINGVDYAVADTDEDADKAARDYIEGSLWDFDSDFIARFVTKSADRDKLARALQIVQAKLCEDANDLVSVLVADRMDDFVQEATSADGRGHFLSPYDGVERDGEDVYAPWKGKLVYRV